MSGDVSAPGKYTEVDVGRWIVAGRRRAQARRGDGTGGTGLNGETRRTDDRGIPRCKKSRTKTAGDRVEKGTGGNGASPSHSQPNHAPSQPRHDIRRNNKPLTVPSAGR